MKSNRLVAQSDSTRNVWSRGRGDRSQASDVYLLADAIILSPGPCFVCFDRKQPDTDKVLNLALNATSDNIYTGGLKKFFLGSFLMFF